MITRRDFVRRAAILTCSGVASCAIPSSASSLFGESSGKSAVEVIRLSDKGKSSFTKILMLGDSNSCGVGQEHGFYGGVMGKVSRSIINNFDRGFGTRRGYSYATMMNPYLEIFSNSGISGRFISWKESGGAGGNLAILKEGSSIVISRRVFDSANFYFHSGSSQGSRWKVLDGDRVIASGSVDQSLETGAVFIPKKNGFESREISLVCTGGMILFQGARLYKRENSGAPSLWCAAEGSQGFMDFATHDRVSSIAPRINETDGKTLVVVMLGTNNQVGLAWKQRYLSEYYSEIEGCISAWRNSIFGEKEFVLVVPPRARVDLPYAKYDEYAETTLKYAGSRPDTRVIRTDLTVLGGNDTGSLYSDDGVHLNESGHSVWADVICRGLGISLDPYLPKAAA